MLTVWLSPVRKHGNRKLPYGITFIIAVSFYKIHVEMGSVQITRPAVKPLEIQSVSPIRSNYSTFSCTLLAIIV
jgi:hypothetical protein